MGSMGLTSFCHQGLNKGLTSWNVMIWPYNAYNMINMVVKMNITFGIVFRWSIQICVQTCKNKTRGANIHFEGVVLDGLGTITIYIYMVQRWPAPLPPHNGYGWTVSSGSSGPPPLWPVVVVWFFWSPPCGLWWWYGSSGPPPLWPVVVVCWYVGMLVCRYVGM